MGYGLWAMGYPHFFENRYIESIVKYRFRWHLALTLLNRLAGAWGASHFCKKHFSL